MEREDLLQPCLDKASRACDLLQHHAETDAGFDHYSIVLSTKAKLHSVLGQHTMAIATLRLADEAFLAMTGKQVVEKVQHEEWRGSILYEGHLLMNSHQVEAAKCCFLKVLSWPGPPSDNVDHVIMNCGMAYYHKEHQDWVSCMKFYSQRPERKVPCGTRKCGC